jgi:gluconate 2-dehydrogenase alpha chain
MEDFSDDNFDHTGQNFIGGTNHSFGGYMGAAPHTFTGIGPNGNNMGSAYKASLKNMKLPTKQTLAVGGAGPNIPTTETYTDLDPHFTDVYGDPLLRVTSDYGINGWNAANYIAPLVGPGLLAKMGCTNITTSKGTPFSTHPHGTNIHWRGGMRMGSDPSWSVTNKWLQSWTIPNLFSCSESSDTFGDTTTAGTHIIGMMSYIAADGIQNYLKTPGPLV